MHNFNLDTVPAAGRTTCRRYSIKNKVVDTAELPYSTYFGMYSMRLFFHKNENVVVGVGGFTYGKGTSISSAFPLKIQCAFNGEMGKNQITWKAKNIFKHLEIIA